MAVLEKEICELAAHLAAATCRWLLLVAEFDARGGWAEWGVKSCAHWLSWRCGIGLHAAREQVRVANRIGELPLVRERFITGELSYSKVRAITRVATPETEADIVMIGRHATGAQLEKLAQRIPAGTARYDGERTSNTRARRARALLGGRRHAPVRGAASPENGALLLAAINAAAVDGEGHMPQRRAQGLMSVVRAETREGEDRPAPAELVVHVDVETLTKEQVGLRSEIEDGPVLAPETVRRLGCDAAVVSIVERDGKPLLLAAEPGRSLLA